MPLARTSVQLSLRRSLVSEQHDPIMVYTVDGMQASVFLQKSFLLPSLLLGKVSSLFPLGFLLHVSPLQSNSLYQLYHQILRRLSVEVM